MRVAVTGGLLATDGPLRRSVLARLKEEPALAPIGRRRSTPWPAPLRLAARERSSAAA